MQSIKKLKTIYLDMDGVLVDFVGGVFKRYDIDPSEQANIKSWDFFAEYDIDEQHFWNTVAARVGFWRDLEPYPYAKAVFNMCHKYAEEVKICTSCGCPAAASGKNDWIKEHLGLASKDVIHIVDKWRLAYMPKTILIDDSEVNLAYWHNACTAANRGLYAWSILFPQPWNTSRHFVDTRLAYLQRNLRVHSTRKENGEEKTTRAATSCD
jgi:5'(3')-deoxyribonucleotidase